MGSSGASDLLVTRRTASDRHRRAGGIGRATVELLESAGWEVAGCDVDDFDVRDRDAVDAGVAKLIEELGGCDAVVANAGVVDTIHRAERFPEDEWQKDLETNLTGPFNVIRAAFEALRGVGRRAGRGRSRRHRPRPGFPARSPTRPRRRGSWGWRGRWRPSGASTASAATW